MRPFAPVIGDAPEDAEISAGRLELGKVFPVVPDEGCDRLDAFQPHVVEHDQAAGIAELGCEVEIDQDVVEAVEAIDEDESEPASRPLEIHQAPVRAILYPFEGERRRRR